MSALEGVILIRYVPMRKRKLMKYVCRLAGGVGVMKRLRSLFGNPGLAEEEKEEEEDRNCARVRIEEEG